MANYNDTTLKTDNPEIFKAVIDRFEKMKGVGNINEWHYNNHKLVWLTAGEQSNLISIYKQFPPDVQQTYLEKLTDIYITSRNGLFHDEAVELSKQFPGDKITCMFTFEDDWHFLETTVEYLNGNDTVVSHAYKPRLCTEYNLHDLIGEDENKAILKKIHDFVVRLYDNKMIREGETVTFEFSNDKYKIVANIPFGPHYDLTVYKAKETKQTDWQKIEPRDDDDDKLPF